MQDSLPLEYYARHKKIPNKAAKKAIGEQAFLRDIKYENGNYVPKEIAQKYNNLYDIKYDLDAGKYVATRKTATDTNVGTTAKTENRFTSAENAPLTAENGTKSSKTAVNNAENVDVRANITSERYGTEGKKVFDAVKAEPQ